MERKKKQKERRAQEITLKLKERWTDECTAAVEFLKDQLTKAPILAWPDFSDTAEPMELHVDASQKGLGAVLRQVQNGELRVINYDSKALSDQEKRWDVRELEAYAVVWGIDRMRSYLQDRQFRVYTDHASLRFLMESQFVSGKLAAMGC